LSEAKRSSELFESGVRAKLVFPILLFISLTEESANMKTNCAAVLKGIACVLGVAMLMMVESSDALNCYSCGGAFGVSGDSCYNVNPNVTSISTCGSGTNQCQTVTSALSVTRSCGNSNSGCTLGVCTYICSTNLCNTQNAAPTSVLRSNTGLFAILTISALALAMSGKFA